MGKTSETIRERRAALGQCDLSRRCTNVRAGLAYSFLMGGRRYTNVNNQFQFGSDEFNIRGVDDGSGFLSLNLGFLVEVMSSVLRVASVIYAV